MVNRSKAVKKPQQGPPIQFRPGDELERLVEGFASRHRMPLNGACKALVALSICSMDSRWYPLILQLSQGFSGADAFVKACIFVNDALEASRRATGRQLQTEAERAPHIIDAIRARLSPLKIALDTSEMWIDLPLVANSSPKVNPTKVRRKVQSLEALEKRRAASEPHEQDESVDDVKAGWTSTPKRNAKERDRN